MLALQCAVCSFGNQGAGRKQLRCCARLPLAPSLLATPSSYFAAMVPPAPQCNARSLHCEASKPAPVVKSHRADFWPLPAGDPTQPAEPLRVVQTWPRSQPRRRGLPRGGRSGQKLPGGSSGIPSGGGRTETPRKNSSGPHSSGTAGPPRLPSLLHRAAAQPRPKFRAK